MTHQPCKCIEEINAALDEHTLDTAIIISRDLRGMTARTYTGLMRKDNGKAETRSRKPRVFGHKFCPFCGSAYDPAPATSPSCSAEVAKAAADATMPEDGEGYSREKWFIARDAALFALNETPPSPIRDALRRATTNCGEWMREARRLQALLDERSDDASQPDGDAQ